MRFAITGFPRSRTKWASVFLSTPDCPVIHDAHPDSFYDIEAVSTPLVITHWKHLPKDTPIAFIKRDVNDVRASWAKFLFDDSLVSQCEEALEGFLSNNNVKIFDYYQLDAKELWEYCHNTAVSNEYIKVFTDMNIVQQQMENIRRVA